MRILLLAVIIISGWYSSAEAQQEVIIECKFTSCPASLRLFRFDGMFMNDSQIKPVTGTDGVVQFSVPATKNPQFYYLGYRNDQTLIILLGTEPKVTVEGSCLDVRTAAISGSPLNKRYNELREKIMALKSQGSQQSQQFMMAAQNPQMQEEIKQQMKALDEQKLQLLNEQAESPFMASIVAINTYLSWPNNTDKHNNEIEYFVNEYFRFANLFDDIYENMPWVFDAYTGYANTIMSIGLDDNTIRTIFNAALSRVPSGSMRHRMALSAISSVLRQKNNGNFVMYAEQMLALLSGPTDEQARRSLEQQIGGMKSFITGAEAPDFAQETPEGKMLKLSDLRGKVVLIDFWASWCGPCRRENPNVVRMYNEYKDKGFEILGVSLDRDRQRWLEAIAADKLTWPHVSDLQQWSNAAAQLYNVSSIPHTVLVDKEGRIIARNLRGEALERKLAEIFKS
jgi:thiol-disulfide isomerase/thioredoxin